MAWSDIDDLLDSIPELNRASSNRDHLPSFHPRAPRSDESPPPTPGLDRQEDAKDSAYIPIAKALYVFFSLVLLGVGIWVVVLLIT